MQRVGSKVFHCDLYPSWITSYHLEVSPIGVPTLDVLLNYHLTAERVPRKIRSPGERTNKEAVSSVSPACSARLIKTIRAATANDKRPTWLLGFISMG
ncbi:hypothetical protein G5I_06719 [Acromyrmex echinatior]|uniref:Uncharacterized protein n=1 Tax=Acromyrmex echinatior TaxID=103372 RepID=F4WLT8_ACREC|nr:hypothetical protein G5I_06719 [Acromyrmex echinatior]